MRTAAIAFALACVVAACSPGSGDASGATTTVAPSSTVTTTVASSSTAAAVAPDTTEPAGPEACFVGDWILDSDQFFADITASGVLGNADTSMVSRGGENTLAISEDGSLTSERSGWSWLTILPEGELQVTVSATQSGTYRIDDGTMAVELQPAEMVELEMLLNGEPVPVPEAYRLQDTLGREARISCEGDVLTAVSGDGFSSTWNRF